MSGKVIVLGAGFSSLSAAAYLAKSGFNVEILEKYSIPGGRSKKLESDGFIFDAGTSFYLIPEVFEKFYNDFNHSTGDFYELIRLNPSFRLFFENEPFIDVPSSEDELFQLFETIEKGSSGKLKTLLNASGKRYSYVREKFLNKPLIKVHQNIVPGYIRTGSYRSLSAYLQSLFKDERLIKILGFPVLFMNAENRIGSSMYSFINPVNPLFGNWYPKGGIYKVAEAFEKICYESGVSITYNITVDQLDVIGHRVSAAHSGNRNFYGEFFVSGFDYYYTDQKLISDKFSNYSQKFWNKKISPPGAIIFYIGLNKKVDGLLHQNIFFNTGNDFANQKKHTRQKKHELPSFFVTVPSKSDSSVCYEGHENIVVVMPIAPGLEDHGKIREYYFDKLIDRIESILKTSIRDNIIFHRSYAQTDFYRDYNSFRGNIHGFTGDFFNTGFNKPAIINKKLQNLFYAGQFAIPGTGIFPSVLGGKIVADQVFIKSGGLKS